MNARFPVSRRLNLALLGLIFLIIAAVSAGVWFSNSSRLSVAAIRQSAKQVEQVNELRGFWSSLLSSVDGLLLTRSTSYRDTLSSQLQEFDKTLTALMMQQIGINQENIQANKESLENVSTISQELHLVITEFNLLTTQGRWGSALTLRQTRLATLQNELNGELAKLSQNIQAESTAALAEAARVQFLTQISWLVIFIFAVATALFVSLQANHTIVKPIKLLINDVKRITAGNQEKIQPLAQNDEIGDLSKAFSTMSDWLRESRETLEQRVAERTQDLERRNIQIQVAAEIARDVARNSQLEELLSDAVKLVRDRFGFYHAGIFLVDARSEYAVLRSATGEAGRALLDRQHKLRIGETGLVGYVCKEGEPRIALDVGQDVVHFKNPQLPETRSEIALPLISGGQVIGALDVQSKEPAAFDEESIQILQVMADQLAAAIENARLLQELQENYQETQALYGNLISQAWQKQRSGAQIAGYQYDGVSLKPLLSGEAEPQVETQPGSKALQIPLRLRGLEIGSLDIYPAGEVLPAHEIALITHLSDRISQILENARLFEDAQRRAERERLTTEITAQMRKSNDPKEILEIAVRELKTALQLNPNLPQDKSALPVVGENGIKASPGNGSATQRES